jgi:hypothetical protein
MAYNRIRKTRHKQRPMPTLEVPDTCEIGETAAMLQGGVENVAEVCDRITQAACKLAPDVDVEDAKDFIAHEVAALHERYPKIPMAKLLFCQTILFGKEQADKFMAGLSPPAHVTTFQSGTRIVLAL